MTKSASREYQTLQSLVELFVSLSSSVDQSVLQQLGRNLESIIRQNDQTQITATTLEGLLTAIGGQYLKCKMAESET
jgi:hypothetical protein